MINRGKLLNGNVLLDWPTNPFVNNITIDGSKEKIKIAFMSVFVAPLRLFLTSFFFGMTYVAALAALIEMDVVKSPLKGLRRKGKDIASTFLIWAHFAIGFHYKIKGKRASPWEAPILVLAPHSTFYDSFAFCALGDIPSVVGKRSLFEAPIVGTILKLTFPIMVDRDSKDSRKLTIEKIKERASMILKTKGTPEACDWSQIAIFPEGTTTNRTQLITFKPGAFYPQLPVQPVCFKWSAKYPTDHVSWTWDGAGVMQLIWLTMCNLRSDLEIEFLPVHVPTEAEKQDATLFARNVQRKMAECLGVPVSDYALEDACYLTTHSTPKLDKVRNLLTNINGNSPTSEFKTLADAWRHLKNSRWKFNSYQIDINEFLEYLNADVSSKSTMQRIFNAFDWLCTGAIDLREFLITKYADPNSFEYLKISYEMFTDNGFLQENDFIKIFRFPYGFSQRKCREVYTSILNSANDNRISLDSLVNLVRQNGIYLRE